MDSPNTNNCPTDLELSAYVDHALTDSAREKVESHLGKCQACRKRASELMALSPREIREISLVGNGDCPSWQEWGQFIEGKASWGYRRRLDRHLLACSRCRCEYARFKLGDPDAGDSRPGPEILALVEGLVSPGEKPARSAPARIARPPSTVYPWVLAVTGAAAIFLAAFLILGNSWKQDNGRSREPASSGQPVWVEGSGPARSPAEGATGSPTEPDTPAEGVLAPSPSPADSPRGPGDGESATPANVIRERPPGEGPDPPPSGEPEEGDRKPGETTVEEPVEEPGPETPSAVTRSEIWETAHFQVVPIQGEDFGELGGGKVAVEGDFLPLPREGAMGVPVKVVRKGLLVDADGDGKPEKLVGKKGGLVRIRVTHSGGVPGYYLAGFSRENGVWCYRGMECMAGRIAGVTAFVFDENGNGRFNDKGVDTIAIDTAHNFAYISPVTLLGENLYNLKISDSGRKVEVQQYVGEVGYVDIFTKFNGGDAQVLTAVLYNETASINATALGWIVPVPVGTYRLHRGGIKSSRENIQFMGTEESVIEVTAKAVAHPSWGGPLTIEFSYAHDANNIRIRARDIHFTGVLGERYVCANRSIARARITIRDAVTFRELKEITQSLFVSGAIPRGPSAAPGGG